MNTTLYAVESLMGRAKTNLKKVLNNYYHDNNFGPNNKTSVMNKKEQINKLIEEALNSVDDIKRAEPKPLPAYPY